MNRFRLFAVIQIFLLAYYPLQAANTPAATVPDLFSQISQAFSPATPVSTVMLSGTAQWYAGSFQDIGTVTLSVAADGSSQTQIALAKKGVWTESQTSIGPSMKCHWAANDGVPHKLSASNCLRPAIWFLPAVMLQSTSLATGVGVAASDLGVGTVGDGTFRHAQLQFSAQSLNSGSDGGVVRASTTDIGVDPISFLPQVVAYKIPPDDGRQIQVPIEIHFSDYRTVNGTQLPFRIQRYLNGTLQLDITISTAQVN